MKAIKTYAIVAATAFAVLQAAPAFACPPNVYLGVVYPPVNYSGTITAAQNIYLHAGSSITSLNGVYRLQYQFDGNLVLLKNGKPVWDPSTNLCSPTPYVPYAVAFQSDGNLVINHALSNTPLNPIPVWDTSTHGHPNARLVVQDDGNVVIYDSNNAVLWAIN